MKKIPLTQGKFAIIDDKDFPSVNQYKWFAIKDRNTFYAGTKIKSKLVKLHNLLMGKPDVFGQIPDHKDGDGLNNKRFNLRFCTRKENSRNSKNRTSNTSGFKGVSWHKRRCKWYSRIKVNYRCIYLGEFTCLIKAAKAYDKAAKKHFGEFARLNFPEDSNG